MQRHQCHSTDATQEILYEHRLHTLAWLWVVLILNFFQGFEAPGMPLCKYYFTDL